MRKADILTTARLILAPVFAYSVYNFNIIVSLVIFILAGITDILDGYFARKEKFSHFGMMYDAAVDKVFILFVVVSVVMKNSLPLYFILLILVKDFYIALMYGIMKLFKSKRKIVPPTVYGKSLVFIQSVVAIMILLKAPYILPAVWFVFVYGICTAADYTVKVLRQKVKI